MKLRGIEFGNIWGASGVQGPRFKGYWFHEFYHYMPGFDFAGLTPTDKTVTAKARAGNVRPSISQALFPQWARIRPWSGHTINAMGLPNEGVDAAAQSGVWQKMDKPFILSFAAVGETKATRMDEWKEIRDKVAQIKSDCRSPFGAQLNLSCPNTGHDVAQMIGESMGVLEIMAPLNISLVPKYSVASAPISAMMELNQNPHCDALCASNTILFGWCFMCWDNVWGSQVSPLKKYGGGGLSGPALKPHVLRWIKALRQKGFTKPINGGGGIFCCQDVDEYKNAGASSVFLGTVATLRPWRVQKIIRHANSLTWED